MNWRLADVLTIAGWLLLPVAIVLIAIDAIGMVGYVVLACIAIAMIGAAHLIRQDDER